MTLTQKKSMFHSKPLLCKISFYVHSRKLSIDEVLKKLQQDGPSASFAPCFFLTHFPYVIKKSKSTFVLKHDPSESNETTFEVARFLVFMLWYFFWKSLHVRESKSDFRENREK